MIRSRAIHALLGTALAAPLLLATTPRAARAQAGLGHLDDATVVPKGQFRFQAITSWTRFNSRFAPDGSPTPTIPLGSEYSFDSLGVAQLPALGGTQGAIQALTGSPFKLSLGRTQAAADARISVTPISVEYGLFHRITVGVMLPLIRTRTSIMLRVNPQDTLGNVGMNPALVNLQALAQDSAVVAQLVHASASLETALQACQADPTANANCGTILARQGDVSTLLQSATTFSTAFSAVYGANADVRGAPVVPVTGTAADLAIRGRLAAFDSSFRAFLSGGALITGTPASAGGVMGTGDLNTFLANPGVAGIDSLASTVRISTGDVQLSARVQLFDGFADSAAAAHPRALVGRATLTATASMPTGKLASPTNPLDIGTGRGTMAAGARLATYLQSGTRLGLSAAASYTKPLGKTKTGAYPIGDGAPFPPSTADVFPYTPGAIMRFELAPRFMVTKLLGVNAMYDYLHVAANDYGAASSVGSPAAPEVATLDGVTGAAGTQQAAGFGITFSTVTEFGRGKSTLPIDITFTHLEALRGTARMPKYFRDQIQIRLYYRRSR